MSIIKTNIKKNVWNIILTENNLSVHFSTSYREIKRNSRLSDSISSTYHSVNQAVHSSYWILSYRNKTTKQRSYGRFWLILFALVQNTPDHLLSSFQQARITKNRLSRLFFYFLNLHIPSHLSDHQSLWTESIFSR
jgi:hypothetical protein